MKREPLPLIIGLAGDDGSGRNEIGKYLKQVHAFAMHALEKPLYDAIQPLYGVSALDAVFAKDMRAAAAADLGLTPRELVAELREHAQAIAGESILAIRLVQRAVQRSEWNQQDLVITDIRTAHDLRWLRLVHGRAWWIQRPNCADQGTRALMLSGYAPADRLIRNDSTLQALAARVEDALAVTRQEHTTHHRINSHLEEHSHHE
jgi:hypothetical protein